AERSARAGQQDYGRCRIGVGARHSGDELAVETPRQRVTCLGAIQRDEAGGVDLLDEYQFGGCHCSPMSGKISDLFALYLLLGCLDSSRIGDPPVVDALIRSDMAAKSSRPAVLDVAIDPGMGRLGDMAAEVERCGFGTLFLGET